MARNRSITSEAFPYLPIRVVLRGWKVEATALLDTGFSGELVIPQDALPQNIGLPEGRTHLNSEPVTLCSNAPAGPATKLRKSPQILAMPTDSTLQEKTTTSNVVVSACKSISEC